MDRDGWDWALLIVSLVAGTLAIVVFPPWALERRRRPEVRIDFLLAEDGLREHMRDWTADRVAELRPGQRIFVLASIRNIGDRSGAGTLINFVVPPFIDITLADGSPAEVLVAPNAARYLVRHGDPWTPGEFLVVEAWLGISPDAEPSERPGRILLTITDERFNRSGRRWLPSILPPREHPSVEADIPWPPPPPKGHRWWRSIRWVRASPHDRVFTSRGSRYEVRDLLALPPQAATPTR